MPNRSCDKNEFKSLILDMRADFKAYTTSTVEANRSLNHEVPLLPNPPKFLNRQSSNSKGLENQDHDNSGKNSTSKIEKNNQSKPRLEFPKFSGKEINEWLYRAERVLEYYNIVEAQKVRMAALHLEKGPLP